MTSRRWRAHRPLRLLGLALDTLLFLGTLTAWGDTQAVGAQSTPELLVQRRAVYMSARSEYDAARQAFDSANGPFTESIGKVSRARAAGDKPALERAYSEAQDRSRPLQAQATRLKRAQAALDSARAGLVAVIGTREEELVREMAMASSTEERDSLNTRYQELNGELHTLEAEAGSASGMQPVVGLLIPPDPRDGPADRLRKARSLERFAAQTDTTIQQTDRSIEELQARLRRQQQRADLMAGLKRFDDTRLPVTSNPPPGDAGSAADSTGTGGRPMTLQERIEALQDYRKQLVSYRDTALERAREFRVSAGGGE